MKPTVESLVTALLEEYRALYQLAVFRLEALDRRAPLTAGAFSAAVVAMEVLPPDTQLVVLWLTPLSLIWVMRTAVNHARSFEDVLRRIEAIELEVNHLAGRPLLTFQSTHPSRGTHVGGRTGSESVAAVAALSTLLVVALVYLAHQRLDTWTWAIGYGGLSVVVLILMLAGVGRLRRTVSSEMEANPA